MRQTFREAAARAEGDPLDEMGRAYIQMLEDRDVLLDPDAPPETTRRYARFFSSRRLRDRARRVGLDRHEDLWEAVRLVFAALGTEQGQPAVDEVRADRRCRESGADRRDQGSLHEFVLPQVKHGRAPKPHRR